MPIDFEILAATVEMCSFQLKCSSIITPKNLMLDLRPIKLFFILSEKLVRFSLFCLILAGPSMVPDKPPGFKALHKLAHLGYPVISPILFSFPCFLTPTKILNQKFLKIGSLVELRSMDFKTILYVTHFKLFLRGQLLINSEIFY